MPHEFLPDREEALKEFLGARNPFLTYIERIKTKLPLGTDIVGAILARMQALWDTVGLGEMADRLLSAPGDRTLNYGDNNVPAKVGLGMPIAYDIWYLFDAGNVLKFGGKTIEETMEKMKDYFAAIDDAKPLFPPGTPPTPIAYFHFTSGESYVVYDTFGAKEYKVKEARYEVFLTGGGVSYPSDGPKNSTNDYVGYIAFPVGPLGVMWGISLATESALSSGSDRVHPVDFESGTIQGGELLPPFDLRISEVAGEKLMNKGWLVEDDTRVEILAADFKGIDNPDFHYWLRYWIRANNTEIVPGEFAGLLCRPWPLHCWWYQKTAPFLYSGHWVETEFYTSGIVKEVLEPERGEVGKRYRVWVKNEEIICKSSDFFEYQKGERVGLLKTWREGEEGEGSNGSVFTWQDLKLLNSGESLTTEWVIVPVGFYEETGNGLGGA